MLALKGAQQTRKCDQIPYRDAVARRKRLQRIKGTSEMKTGDFPYFKTHFGSLDSKEHLDGNDMKRKKKQNLPATSSIGCMDEASRE